MTRRRWIADEWSENSAVLRDAAAAHLARVLRARPGQSFDIVAGGVIRRGIVERVGGDAVEFSLHEEVAAPPPFPLVVGLSVFRFEPMEWAVEKLTELGAARVVPIAAQRSDKHLVLAAAKRVERWRRIARGAAQQSRGVQAMEIAAPMPLPQWMEEVPEGLRLLLSEQERSTRLRDILDRTEIPSGAVSLAIGPEGGWTPAEIAGFDRRGWQAVTLGSRILRAETAAIVAVSTLTAWLEPPAL